MKQVPISLAALGLAALPALAQDKNAPDNPGWIMGPGEWTCEKVLEVDATGSDIDAGLLAGWIMGYWSAETFTHDDAFDATVAQFGGKGIYDVTISQCRDVRPDVTLSILTQAIIQNTK